MPFYFLILKLLFRLCIQSNWAKTPVKYLDSAKNKCSVIPLSPLSVIGLITPQILPNRDLFVCNPKLLFGNN